MAQTMLDQSDEVILYAKHMKTRKRKLSEAKQHIERRNKKNSRCDLRAMSISTNRILINIWHLLYGTTTAALLNALALVVLASYLQAHDYGVFSVVLAVA